MSPRNSAGQDTGNWRLGNWGVGTTDVLTPPKVQAGDLHVQKRGSTTLTEMQADPTGRLTDYCTFLTSSLSASASSSCTDSCTLLRSHAPGTSSSLLSVPLLPASSSLAQSADSAIGQEAMEIDLPEISPRLILVHERFMMNR